MGINVSDYDSGKISLREKESKMKKISVIMPVYNSEKYVSKAIESVLAQDFEDFELILVNDGSTDNSAEICDQFAEKYEKVRVIHKKNGGICSARNAGLDAAEGEYIGFCDNDDIYLPHLLSDNYRMAVEHQVDLMRYAKIKRVQKEDGRVREVHAEIKDMFIEKRDFATYYQNIRKEDTVWTGLYRKEIIDKYKIRFDERFKYGLEDMNFNLKFLMHCERLGFNSKEYYSWTQREVHSTSKKFHKEHLGMYLINLKLEYTFMTEVCGDTLNDVMKNIFLVNVYVYPAVEYMLLKSCDMQMREKVTFLKKLREMQIFKASISRDTMAEVRRKNVRVYLSKMLFYKKKYRLLINIMTGGSWILDKVRYKKN